MWLYFYFQLYVTESLIVIVNSALEFRRQITTHRKCLWKSDFSAGKKWTRTRRDVRLIMSPARPRTAWLMAAWWPSVAGPRDRCICFYAANGSFFQLAPAQVRGNRLQMQGVCNYVDASVRSFELWQLSNSSFEIIKSLFFLNIE